MFRLMPYVGAGVAVSLDQGPRYGNPLDFTGSVDPNGSPFESKFVNTESKASTARVQ